ncbi:hypothetical protein ACQKEU_06870, partial [Acidovorax sp. NPDC077664]
MNHAIASSTQGTSAALPDGALLQVQDLVREYTLPREHLFRPPGTVKALNGVSFSVAPGRSLGIVGESGSGKYFKPKTLEIRVHPALAAIHFDESGRPANP